MFLPPVSRRSTTAQPTYDNRISLSRKGVLPAPRARAEGAGAEASHWVVSDDDDVLKTASAAPNVRLTLMMLLGQAIQRI
jgi:hypothetical protein